MNATRYLAGFFFCATAAAAAPFGVGDFITRPWEGEKLVAPHIVPVMLDPIPSEYRVPAPPELRLQQKGLVVQQAAFVVNFLPAGSVSNIFGTDTCVTWPAQAQAAYNYAVAIWASQLQSSVPIKIDACFVSSLPSNTLGHGGFVNSFANFPNAPRANTWYPIAIANALRGVDLDVNNADIYSGLNSTTNWYFGTDGVVPAGQLDFVSLVLHEIAHGLGFSGTMNVVAGSGKYGSPGAAGIYPFDYDSFAENGAVQSLTNTGLFPNPSAALASALQSGSVFFNGPNASAANGGSHVPLFAPSVFLPGSSFVHLGENYNNTPDALMTYSFASGESIHSPGPVTLGVMKDLGWALQTASTADVALTNTVNANPATVGKDVVFTMTATNNGPGTATGVTVYASYDAAATVIWASPACAKDSSIAQYACAVGTLANGATTTFKLVLRKDVPGSVYNNAGVSTGTIDPNSANNAPTLAVNVNAGPVATQVLRYRLYSPVTKEHHFTTDLNEYTVLGGNGNWVQEGTVGKVLSNPGIFNGVTATPYYRLYNTTNQQHHWTTDANEYYTLVTFPGWNGEGVDGYILPSATTGTLQLYRLLYPFVAGLHHWTIDANEYNTLITPAYGWIGEGGSGFVIQ